MTPTDYCRQQAVPPGSDLYYSTLFQPPAQQRGLFAIFAFQNELDQIILECSDPGVARIKLQWWREETVQLINDESRHPVSKELNHLIISDQLNPAKLTAYIDHIEWLLAGDHPETYQQLTSRFIDGPGQLISSTTEISAPVDTDLSGLVAKIWALTNLLWYFQHSRQLIDRGVSILPRREMEAHALDRYRITQKGYIEQTRALFSDLFNSLEKDLHASYRKIESYGMKQLLYCQIINRLALVLCTELRKAEYPLMEAKIALTPIRKLWIAWLTKWGLQIRKTLPFIR